MPVWLQFVTILSSVVAGPGFWAWMQRRDKTRSATDRLLRGLAYDKIITSGMMLIERGWVTKDELEEFRKYLFEPYKALGGNGVAERIMREVDGLPLKSNLAHSMMIQQLRRSSSNGRHSHRSKEDVDDQRALAER